MYRWRELSEKDRSELLEYRQHRKFPWHSPPHLTNKVGSLRSFHISVSCYEHADIIGYDIDRMENFALELLSFLEDNDVKVNAWVVLPNHYHILIKTDKIEDIRKKLSQLHGRKARVWNLEEDKTGRRVWFNSFDAKIKNSYHFYGTLNYIHHNPVKHKYVTKWIDWSFSSAHEYIEKYGRDQVMENWRLYDCSKMGSNWDNY